jgi:osmotically-inducible protein OsmY
MKLVNLLAAGTLVALAGCTQQQSNAVSSAASNAAAGAAPAASAVNDALLVARVEGAFVTIDPDSSLHVAVASHDGHVKLTGKVRTAASRDAFVAAAKKIDSVKSVDAALNVDPKMPTDQQAATDFALVVAVDSNIAAQAGINAFSVHVDAHAGTVTLHGSAPTRAIDQTIVDAAKHAPGVKNVRDRLKVGS